ncbi:hypothetical protein Lalb_Chr10g0093021 [Lupinus albus]|uniref:Uncharacterized protein n=1 Tax=Lupinus albus TaxID=3870 RepID=A0A6A4PU95_LUPAL|nr:hypothetical protein Lalb_Chr10g0093021 [Lupinus albus]
MPHSSGLLPHFKEGKFWVLQRVNLYGLYLKTWKGMFLCPQQKPKPTELWIL